jgi:hypothetical protein
VTFNGVASMNRTVARCRTKTIRHLRKVDRQKIREGMLAAAAVGYLCKHHATLSAAEGTAFLRCPGAHGIAERLRQAGVCEDPPEPCRSKQHDSAPPAPAHIVPWGLMPSRLWMPLTAKGCSQEVFGECNPLNPSLGEGCAVSVLAEGTANSSAAKENQECVLSH